MFDAAKLLACHGMSGQDALPCLGAKDHARALDELLLGAAGVGDEGRGRKRGSDGLELRQDGADRSGEDDDVTADNGAFQIGFGTVDGFAFAAPCRSTGRLSQPTIVPANPCCRRASPSDPPIRPVPTIVIC